MSRTRHFSRGSTSHHVWGLNPDHRFCLHFNSAVKLQTKSNDPCFTHSIAYWTGPYHWLYRRRGQFNKQDVVIHSRNYVFSPSLIESCFVERVGVKFSIILLLFHLLFFGGRLCSRTLMGLTVNRCLGKIYLHCRHPVTIIICRSGYILIYRQGYLSFTLHTTASENRRCTWKWRQ